MVIFQGAYLGGMWLYRLDMTTAKEYALTVFSGPASPDVHWSRRRV